MSKKAVVLLSGGLDSATVLAIVRSRGFAAYALSFRYGQRHEAELQAAKTLSTNLGAVEHVVAEIDLRIFGGSALTADVAVPKGRSEAEIGGGIPITYVPRRCAPPPNSSPRPFTPSEGPVGVLRRIPRGV